MCWFQITRPSPYIPVFLLSEILARVPTAACTSLLDLDSSALISRSTSRLTCDQGVAVDTRGPRLPWYEHKFSRWHSRSVATCIRSNALYWVRLMSELVGHCHFMTPECDGSCRQTNVPVATKRKLIGYFHIIPDLAGKPHSGRCLARGGT